MKLEEFRGIRTRVGTGLYLLQLRERSTTFSNTKDGTETACATKVLPFSSLLNLVGGSSVEKNRNNGSV